MLRVTYNHFCLGRVTDGIDTDGQAIDNIGVLQLLVNYLCLLDDVESQ